ncbi:MAG TPA: MBL fold metallo-hydrolase [Longimicrobiales bacterium]|nr:MBL fold metallo-hydrolase [Longimicrobiales bacterium]
MSRLHVETFASGAFAQNGYIVWEDDATFAVAIDPGAAAPTMADFLVDNGLFCEAILLTHAHLDHIEGVAELVRRTGAAIHMHADDRALYDRVQQQAVAFGLEVESQPPIDATLEHGQRLRFGGIELEVRHVPGHSPGHVMFYSGEGGFALVGDVVFAGSIGRTDLPGGSMPTLMQSIRSQVLTLPDETVLYPGHGPSTTVERERVGNPFLVPNFGGSLA